MKFNIAVSSTGEKNPSSGTEFCFFGGFSLSEFLVFYDDGCMPYKRF